jgi:hypothetical protein
LSAAALVAVVAAGAALAAAPTKLERWLAFRAAAVSPGVHIVQRGQGYCFTGSLADARTDAWRCFLGNEIEDPCFSGSGAFVICPDGTPDSRDALELRLTKPLPHSRANPPGDPTRRDPWVIVTAGGATCYRVTGTSAVEAGRELTYECAGASALAGSPNRTRPVWTINLLPNGTSKRYVTTAVGSAWW